ncbi:MAG: hypothetical protein HY849_01530 [Nitrosomonadales bacterium]|nr:hypothetical protein [Nitrosomonadales bacterium]
MKKIDQLLRAVPKSVMVVGLLILAAIFFYLDHYTGPRVPLTLLYLLTLFVAIKYVGIRFGYAMALLLALGKTHISHLFHPEDTELLSLFRLASNWALYSLFCFLMYAQMDGRKRAESALDDLSRLHQAIINKTDSGIVVFKATGECRMANRAAAIILGGTQGQVEQSDFRHISSWQGSGMLELADAVLRSGRSRQFEAPLHTEFGKDIWCIATLGRIDMQEGPHLLVVFTDMSHLKAAVTAMNEAHQTAEIALSRAGAAERRIINISEETQQRIGQELHDDLGQRLTGVAFLSEVLFQKLKGHGLQDEMQDAAKVTALINDAIAKTRQLAHGLYPVEVKEGGLEGMLAQLASDTWAIYGIACELDYDESCRFKHTEEIIHLYRICQEAVNNAVKHSACNRISLTVILTSVGRIVEIADNGSWFGDRIEAQKGLGMHSMRYRASLIGATLDIDSMVSGGTSVTICLPEKTGESNAA